MNDFGTRSDFQTSVRHTQQLCVRVCACGQRSSEINLLTKIKHKYELNVSIQI